MQLNTGVKEIQQLNTGWPDHRHNIRPKPSHQKTNIVQLWVSVVNLENALQSLLKRDTFLFFCEWSACTLQHDMCWDFMSVMCWPSHSFFLVRV